MAFENKKDQFSRMLQISDQTVKSPEEIKTLIPVNQSKKRYTFNLKESTHDDLCALAERNNYSSVSRFLDDLITNICK